MKYLIAFTFFVASSLHAQSDFEKAKLYFDSGKYPQAVVLFEKYQKQHPENLTVLEYLGDCQSHLGDWKLALPYYQRLKSCNPSEAEYCYKYGGAMAMIAKESNVFKALSMMDEIEAAFFQTVKLNPKHVGARWALIEIYLQLPSIFGGSEKKAIAYSNELQQISPVDGYLSRGHIEEHYKRYLQAEKQYKKAIDVGNSPTTYRKLADLYKNKMEQPEKARQVLAAYNEKNKL